MKILLLNKLSTETFIEDIVIFIEHAPCSRFFFPLRIKKFKIAAFYAWLSPLNP